MGAGLGRGRKGGDRARLFAGFSPNARIHGRKSWGPGRRMDLGSNPFPLFTGCVPLSKSLPLSELFVSSYVKWNSYGSDLIASLEGFINGAVCEGRLAAPGRPAGPQLQFWGKNRFTVTVSPPHPTPAVIPPD